MGVIGWTQILGSMEPKIFKVIILKKKYIYIYIYIIKNPRGGGEGDRQRAQACHLVYIYFLSLNFFPVD